MVTFTVKAADELKARLDALMRQRINEAVSSADVRFLRNQRMRLRKARISTISSFCISLLRENIDLADNISAGFSVIDETAGDALKTMCCRICLRTFTQTATRTKRNRR